MIGEVLSATRFSDSGSFNSYPESSTEREIQVMSVPRRKFTQEFRDELCREVIDTSKPIADVAKAYGVGTETLRVWIGKYRHVHGGASTVLGVPDLARLRELERENQDFRAETLFLKKAAAHFAWEQLLMASMSSFTLNIGSDPTRFCCVTSRSEVCW